MAVSTVSERQSISAILRSFFVATLLMLFILMPIWFTTLDVVASDVTDVCSTFGTGSCLGGTPRGDGATNTNTLGDNLLSIVISIANLLTYLSVGVALIFVIIGGYQIITSNGDQNRAKAGLDALKNAVIGIIIAIVAYTVVFLVGSFVADTKVLCDTVVSPDSSSGC